MTDPTKKTEPGDRSFDPPPENVYSFDPPPQDETPPAERTDGEKQRQKE